MLAWSGQSGAGSFALVAGARARPRIAAALAFGALVAACAGGDDNRVTPPVVLGMTDKMAPFYEDEQTSIFQVSTPVSLPVRRATDEERQALGKAAPYPREPFFKAGDARFTIRYTLSNLDDKQRIVELLVDPWNEFVRYRPGVNTSNEEMAMPNLSGIDKFFVLPPKSRVEGIFTPDDMNELATDLATAQGIAAKPPAADSDFGGPGLYNRAFNIQNRKSYEDPLLKPFVPGVIAGLTGFDLGIRSSAAGNVAVEIVIDVESLNGDRILPDDTQERPIGPPGRILSPPAGAAMP